MATLSTNPGSSTPLQHQALVIAGRNRGFDLADIRQIVTGQRNGSIRKLSAAEASKWIQRFSGKKPSPYKGKRTTPGVTRMIHTAHIEQILRMGSQYFGNARAFTTWLTKDFKVPYVELGNNDDVRQAIRQLGTAKRAAEVIQVLRIMIARRVVRPAERMKDER